MEENEKNPIVILAEKSGVSKVTVYHRIHEIYRKEGKFRLPTLAELKKRKAGRKPTLIKGE